jgi:hypothetical protein
MAPFARTRRVNARSRRALRSDQRNRKAIVAPSAGRGRCQHRSRSTVCLLQFPHTPEMFNTHGRATCSIFGISAPRPEASIDHSVVGRIDAPHLPAVIGIIARLEADEHPESDPMKTQPAAEDTGS